MKILIVINSMANGGAERVTANLGNHWALTGNEVTVVTLASEEMDFYQLEPSIKRVGLNIPGDSSSTIVGLFRNVVRVRAIRKVLKELKPDIAIGMMATSGVNIALASWGLPVKTIACEHCYPPQHPMGAVREALRKHTYHLLGAVTVLTNECKDWIEKNTRANKVITLPNSVTWPMSVTEPQLYPDHVYTPGKKRLLAAGRLDRYKGFDYLLSAFATLAEKHQDWELAIVGEGSLRADLEKQIKELNLTGRVFLPGRAGNVGEWYKAADLYVLSSRSEGFPMALVEAMAHGLTAACFDCDTGPRDIIRHEVNGLLAKPEDVPELAKALDRLMSDDQLRAKLAIEAPKVKEEFSIERIAQMWETLFNQL